MHDVLIIKTNMLLKQDVLDKYQKLFTEQVKSGVVVIPAYFEAELINVPDDIKVIVKAEDEMEELHETTQN